MADVFAFWDPEDLSGSGERYDFSEHVAGRPGQEHPAISLPRRLVTRSESFIVPGAFIGSWHDSTREIRIPIGIKGASWNAAVEVWESIVAELDVSPQALKMHLHLASDAVFWEVLPSSTGSIFYETWDQRPPATTIRGELLLEVQPYPIGQDTQRTFSEAP